MAVLVSFFAKFGLFGYLQNTAVSFAGGAKFMTDGDSNFLQALAGLSDAEREDVARDILRRLDLTDGEVSEQVLIDGAVALFRVLDAEDVACTSPSAPGGNVPD
jgi:hypothetical protein